MGDDIHPHPGICGGTVMTPNQPVAPDRRPLAD
jgi:hypothetical protein